MKYLILLLTMVLFNSCGKALVSNSEKLHLIKENFAKKYTGLDTLIRIDGYFYRKDETGLKLPIIFSEYGEFKIFRYGSFKTQEELKNAINSLKSANGSYTIVEDTIKLKWIEYYELSTYSLYTNHFVIVNDTSLRQVWYSCETCSDNRNDTNTNFDYHFAKY